MRELLYTILDLEAWNSGGTCDFCSRFENSENQSVCQIRTRSKTTHKLVSNDCVCQRCKEKFENDELPKCERCGKLQTTLDRNTLCDCIKYNEDIDEKELPVLPHERRPYAFYERQINALQEQLTTTEGELLIEREEVAKFQEKSEEWNKRQKKELIDEIERLKKEVERLKALSPQELIAEITQLKTQLEQFTSQQVAQVEVKEAKKWPWKIRK